MGAAHDPAAVRALTTRLIKDEAHGLVVAIAAGLRETASDDDEFVQMVSAAADMVRNDIAEGPIINALIDVGRAKPNEACRVAEGLLKAGDSEYAAFLIGAAYGGAAGRCDCMIRPLASSDNPADVAASLRALRVAHAEHGTPSAGRIAGAVDDALRACGNDDDVCREAMEALLDIHGADRERTGPMIMDLAASRDVCKPILASCISLEALFDDDGRLDCLDACIEGVSAADSGVVRSAYRLLGKMAGGHPDRVARRLVYLAERGAYVDNLADLVIAELGKRHPDVALGAILSLLKLLGRAEMEAYLPSMVRRAAGFSDPASVSGPMLAALESEPGMSKRCRRALAELAMEN